MQMSYMLFCVSFCVLSPQLSRTHGMTLRGLEKRGWTLNSAGYLLGPYAHRTLTVRHGASVGKRDSTEDSILPTHQPSYRSVTDESYLHALMELFMYLRMKDDKSIEDLISSTFTDDVTR
ncbi:galanin peptides-like [Pangasianodon hypophthalmus]|uniref:galanin peptides-like n=1 Tax=Pangasianodon hypophthalmus TaxID=310915 RepID=UPI001480AA53|nr:galanin peptides-like [Pangasianodon hypophthalmus]